MGVRQLPGNGEALDSHAKMISDGCRYGNRARRKLVGIDVGG